MEIQNNLFKCYITQFLILLASDNNIVVRTVCFIFVVMQVFTKNILLAQNVNLNHLLDFLIS